MSAHINQKEREKKKMVKVIGLEEKKGAFVPAGKSEEVQYHNYILHIILDTDKNVKGYKTAQVKLKADGLERRNFADMEQLIGHEIELAYDVFSKYPQVTAVTLTD